jgi:transcriptional regulator with XRE-family HTH domain
MRVLDPKRIKKLMVIKGISQRQLAEILGWESHSYLGRILRGEIKSVQPDVAARIAEYLEVGMDDLFLPRVSSGTPQNAKRRHAA